jgi:hypothetical protein
MWTFLVILVLVFAAVDLLVKYVVDPMASKKWKKGKNTKEKILESSIGLVGATMYDGGKSKDNEDLKNKSENNDNKNGDNPVK